MKLAAHPLVVAVALGLLPAHALAEEEDRDMSRTRSLPCEGCPDAEGNASPSMDDLALEGLLETLRDGPSEEEEGRQHL